MARNPREWTPHTTYHITCRGNRRSDIFKDEADFEFYLELLQEALNQFRRKTPYDLLCYCLMDNHVHLLIHTSNKPLYSSQSCNGQYGGNAWRVCTLKLPLFDRPGKV